MIEEKASRFSAERKSNTPKAIYRRSRPSASGLDPEAVHRNTFLIKQQCPEATRVAGYRTWQEESDRHVQEEESAICIWAPIITTQCPECENSPSYHEESDCDYDETPPEEWSEGLVGFKPAPVFDVSQTEGEPLPDLDTEATGDAGDLVEQLTAAAGEVGVTVRIVPAEKWTHGKAKGICEQLSLVDMQPRVQVRDPKNDADLARNLELSNIDGVRIGTTAGQCLDELNTQDDE